jgi:Cu(I)/Ag(I) efflux system membrane fusion protein
VNPGTYIARGEAIYEIADLSRVWVLFDLYESDVPWVQVGDKVTFTVASLPGTQFEGEISFIDPLINPQTRVAKARVIIRNTRRQLKPEMFASGRIEASIPDQSNTLVIPKSAVLWTGKRSVVYLKSTTDSGISFKMREVTLGPAMGDSYLVEDGLGEGEEIAVHGTFSVDAAAQLAGKPSMMSPDLAKKAMKMIKPAKDVENIPVPTEVSDEAKKALRPIFADYMTFKDALVSDQFEEGKLAATQLKETLLSIGMSAFSGDTHDAWMHYSSHLKNALEHVEHLSNIEELRAVFQPVSNAMIALATSFNPLEKELFVQHCPMADDFNGADWLSFTKEIRNPYFGASMLTCGEVTNEIK